MQDRPERRNVGLQGDPEGLEKLIIVVFLGPFLEPLLDPLSERFLGTSPVKILDFA